MRVPPQNISVSSLYTAAIQGYLLVWHTHQQSPYQSKYLTTNIHFSSTHNPPVCSSHATLLMLLSTVTPIRNGITPLPASNKIWVPEGFLIIWHRVTTTRVLIPNPIVAVGVQLAIEIKYFLIFPTVMNNITYPFFILYIKPSLTLIEATVYGYPVKTCAFDSPFIVNSSVVAGVR